MNERRTRSLPLATHTRLQWLLDDGDVAWFGKHPGATERRRFFFRGELVEGGGPVDRYVVVAKQADGSLGRRFLVESEGAA